MNLCDLCICVLLLLLCRLRHCSCVLCGSGGQAGCPQVPAHQGKVQHERKECWWLVTHPRSVSRWPCRCNWGETHDTYIRQCYVSQEHCTIHVATCVPLTCASVTMLITLHIVQWWHVSHSCVLAHTHTFTHYTCSILWRASEVKSLLKQLMMGLQHSILLQVWTSN